MTLAQALVAEIAADPAALNELRALLGTSSTRLQPDRPAYTVATLAAALHVSAKTIRGAIQRGELSASKRGARYVIAADAVDAWATAHATSALPPQRHRARSRSHKPQGVMKSALETLRDAR